MLHISCFIVQGRCIGIDGDKMKMPHLKCETHHLRRSTTPSRKKTEILFSIKDDY